MWIGRLKGNRHQCRFGKPSSAVVNVAWSEAVLPVLPSNP
jgi:hypothetical protein